LSQAQPIGLPQSGNPYVHPDVRASIARAAQATGVDFDYLLAQARIESSLEPRARAGSSSAAGLYQFTNSTWLATLDRHGERHGLDWAASAIDNGRISEPGMRAQIMAMRFDPDASALMAGELANDNREILAGVLGREPDATELYMAHFLGSDGAARFLSALDTDPGQSAASILPKAATANRGIFFGAGGEPRSVAGVMDLMRRKVASAMDGAGGLPVAAAAQAHSAQDRFTQPTGGPIARQFQSASKAMGAADRVSMAETLRNAFGSGGAAAHAGTPGFVRTAYAKLQAFGL
jgi:hypothetical protein